MAASGARTIELAGIALAAAAAILIGGMLVEIRRRQIGEVHRAQRLLPVRAQLS